MPLFARVYLPLAGFPPVTHDFEDFGPKGAYRIARATPAGTLSGRVETHEAVDGGDRSGHSQYQYIGDNQDENKRHAEQNDLARDAPKKGFGVQVAQHWMSRLWATVLLSRTTSNYGCPLKG